jgi:hypothetical protein
MRNRAVRLYTFLLFSIYLLFPYFILPEGRHSIISIVPLLLVPILLAGAIFCLLLGIPSIGHWIQRDPSC